MEKQIEEMAKVLGEIQEFGINRPRDEGRYPVLYPSNKEVADYLISKGYRRASYVARETIGEAIEVVRRFFDEAKMRADHETNVLLRSQLRGEQIGASLVERALAELKKKYESEGGE